MDELVKDTPVITSIPNNRKLFSTKVVIIAGLIIIILITILFWMLRNPKNTVFSIEGTNYTVTSLSPVASFPINYLNIKPNTEYSTIMKWYKDKLIASRLEIYPSAAQISVAQKSLDSEFKGLTTYSGYKSWSSSYAIDNAIQTELTSTQYINGNYQGYSYIFWFGNTVDAGPTYSSPNEGNQTIYAQDKSYALSQAKYYLSQLSTNKMTADQVLSSVTADKKLLVDGLEYQSVKFGFNSNESWNDQVFYQDVANTISSQSAPGLSNIKTGTITEGPPSLQTVPAFYYFIKVNKIGFSNVTFQTDLKNLKYTYYGVK